MSDNLKIGVSPITNKICIGRVLKGGIWCKNRTDVTNEAILAVIDHAIRFKKETGDNIKIKNEDGSIFCEMVINV